MERSQLGRRCKHQPREHCCSCETWTCCTPTIPPILPKHQKLQTGSFLENLWINFKRYQKLWQLTSKSFHFHEVHRSALAVVHLHDDISAGCLLACDDYVLPRFTRSSETTKEAATRKHVTGSPGRWKFIWDADLNIPSSFPTAIYSVEYFNPLNGDRGAEVKGNPGRCVVIFWVAYRASGGGDTSVNTLLCCRSGVICGWLRGSNRLELNPYELIFHIGNKDSLKILKSLEVPKDFDIFAIFRKWTMHYAAIPLQKWKLRRQKF